MKLFSWNCNRALHKKFKLFEKLDYDLFIIQECENLNKFENIKNKRWIGQKNGLGIIWSDNLDIKFLDWEDYDLDYFIPMVINKEILIIGLWAYGNYIEDVCVYFNIHFEKIKSYSKIVIIGDFN
ncbi:MAG: hypothetical protein ACRC1R_08585, partial [Cetobacterium sp.]|uniref:hypothetical protein n=1 Tax=Cetobacterium sp. TaxID=2071632 RepID=UPI003F3F0777